MEQQRLVEESDFKNTQEIFSGLKDDLIIDIKNPKVKIQE